MNIGATLAANLRNTLNGAGATGVAVGEREIAFTADVPVTPGATQTESMRIRLTVDGDAIEMLARTPGPIIPRGARPLNWRPAAPRLDRRIHLGQEASAVTALLDGRI